MINLDFYKQFNVARMSDINGGVSGDMVGKYKCHGCA